MKPLRLICLVGAALCSWHVGHAQTLELVGDTAATITTTAEGQIGKYESAYKYADGVKEKLAGGKVKYFTVNGPINDYDVNAILLNDNQKNVIKLDLSGATIDHLEGTGSDNTKNLPLGTFNVAGSNAGYPLTYLALPKITSTTKTSIPTLVISPNSLLEDGTAGYATVQLLTTLIIPEGGGYTKIEKGAFGSALKSGSSEVSLVIPEGIDTIEAKAFYDCRKLTSLTLPRSLKYIGNDAFHYHTCKILVFKDKLQYLGESSFLGVSDDLQDVYFLGKDAPVCANDVFGSATYTGHGGHTPVPAGQDYATRDNFINGGHYFCILHYRPDLTDEQLANYWDIKRVYTYKDLYLGNERTWPKQEEYTKAHGPNNPDDSKVGAINGYLFDGTEMTDEQKKHIGILRFVLGRADAPIPDHPLTIKDNSWWTLCLPYCLSKEEIHEYFGDETQLWQLSSVTRNYDTYKIDIVFQKALDADDSYKVDAWMPYILKPSRDFAAEDKIVINKDPEPGSALTVSVTAKKTGEDITDADYDWVYSFHGSCSGMASYEKGIHYHRPFACYFMGGKVVDGKTIARFYYQNLSETNTDGNIWNPYTCVLIPYKTSTSTKLEEDADDSFPTPTGNKAKSYATVWGEGDTDAIWTVNIITPDNMIDGNIYNMQGQLVKAHADSTDGLPKGMYIHNGKKIVVK